jgi:hypothetical protein
MSLHPPPPPAAAAIGFDAFESWARRLIRVRAGLERTEGGAKRKRRPRKTSPCEAQPGSSPTPRGTNDDSE